MGASSTILQSDATSFKRFRPGPPYSGPCGPRCTWRQLHILHIPRPTSFNAPAASDALRLVFASGWWRWVLLVEDFEEAREEIQHSLLVSHIKGAAHHFLHGHRRQKVSKRAISRLIAYIYIYFYYDIDSMYVYTRIIMKNSFRLSFKGVRRVSRERSAATPARAAS